MRYLLLIICVLVCVGCGSSTPGVSWPATATLSGFAEQELTDLQEALGELNVHSARTLVSPVSDASNISIVKVEIIPKKFVNGWETAHFKTAGRSAFEYVAGRATLSSGSCKIEIAASVASDPDLLYPVIWHELGHCAGMGHSENQDDIMFRMSSRIQTYDDTSLDRFFKAMIRAAGL